MKQKYLLEKNISDNRYILKEFGELYPGHFTLMCTEQYDAKIMDKAMGKEKELFFNILRTDNIFPHQYLANKLFNAAITIKDANEDITLEILFEDVETIVKEEPEEDLSESEKESLDVDKEENVEEENVEEENIEEENVELDSILDDSDTIKNEKPNDTDDSKTEETVVGDKNETDN